MLHASIGVYRPVRKGMFRRGVFGFEGVEAGSLLNHAGQTVPRLGRLAGKASLPVRTQMEFRSARNGA